MCIIELMITYSSFTWMIIGLFGMYLMKILVAIHNHTTTGKIKNILFYSIGIIGYPSLGIFVVATVITIIKYW